MDRRKSQLITVKLKIWGIVQGVGFRPFVAKLADTWGISGWVRNTGGLVHLTGTGLPEQLDGFIIDLREKKPLPAEIVHIQTETVSTEYFDGFSILGSDAGEDETVMLSPDLSICPECLAELQNAENRRYRHPFISCMACGPRYTIIDLLPYDRENTSMVDFPMCGFCQKEYTDREERRYHAQTISCHDCGPVLLGKVRGESDSNRENALSRAVGLLKAGEIIAVKGVGGYHLVCSPFDDRTVKNLREMKHREEKPFAVMFRDLPSIREYCMCGEDEEQLLLSSAKPIVLLERKRDAFASEVCKTSRYVGSFLPSMGLHWLLTDACGPLIATSANLSDRPLIKDDAEMFTMLDENPLLAGVFYNERKIRVSLDDSVVRVIDGTPQMIRRSKGYAPSPLYIGGEDVQILAVGGQLKAAFCLTKGGFAYVSQYFGDLDSLDICGIYEENVDRMKRLFQVKPALAVCDMHPLYFTSDYAKNLGIPLLQVQHHHAHVASVMAEHNLNGVVLGVSFDGTGYGTDGAVWGGEFLLCEGADVTRAAHLEYTTMLGGDGSIKEGWKSALCYQHKYLKNGGGDTRYPLIAAALDNHINTVKSSSMGRLFDAVSAFLGLCAVNNYEGECAIALENKAAECTESPYSMAFGINDNNEISAEEIFKTLQSAMDGGVEVKRLALGFHYAVAEMIAAVCRKINVKQVALTGGVFQNKILMEITLSLLRSAGFEVYYNSAVPPNDGGIALGQAYLGMRSMEKEYRSCV